MDWQQLVSLAVVGVTAAIFLWSRFRPRKFSFQRELHCAGCAVRQTAPQHSIIYRARKGERPQVVVKMK